MGTDEIYCYNKGCGRTFTASDNNDESCCYHSGAPIFHDAYKSWSCCEKRTTDFTEFLNIKGCVRGMHNGVKPPDPTRIKPKENEQISLKPPERLKRPDENLPLVPLPTKIAPSLQKLLENLSVSNEVVDTAKHDLICQRKGCGKAKSDESDSKVCTYHSGSPIFHEGYKYWSCCQKKTTDFDVFLQQGGCTTGSHIWGDPSAKKSAKCRYDWHQTGDTVSVTVYVKNVKPDLCTVTCNPVRLKLEITFGDDQVFNFEGILNGIIIPEESHVQFFKTKVEVLMRKAEFFGWSKLVQE